MNIALIGGVRSGKSKLAQQLLIEGARLSEHSALAVVFGRSGVDDEFDQRIAHHQLARPEEIDTLDLSRVTPLGWVAAINREIERGYRYLAIDCVGTALGLVMDDVLTQNLGSDWAELPVLPVEMLSAVETQFVSILSSFLELEADVVFVTNELGTSPVSEYASTRLFTDVMGRCNQLLNHHCDKAYYCVAGTPIDLKVTALNIDWE